MEFILHEMHDILYSLYNTLDNFYDIAVKSVLIREEPLHPNCDQDLKPIVEKVSNTVFKNIVIKEYENMNWVQHLEPHPEQFVNPNLECSCNIAHKNVIKEESKNTNVNKTISVQHSHPDKGQDFKTKYEVEEIKNKILDVKTPQSVSPLHSKNIFHVTKQKTSPKKPFLYVHEIMLENRKKRSSTPILRESESNSKPYKKLKVKLEKIIQSGSYISKPTKCNNSLYKQLKMKVERAIRAGKTFTVCGSYNTVRKALLARGWIEKIKVSPKKNGTDLIQKLILLPMANLLEGVDDPTHGILYKQAIMSKMLISHQVDFYWDRNIDSFRVCQDCVKLTILNRIQAGVCYYNTKQGLCDTMKAAYWFQKPDLPFLRYPRTYNLINTEDPKEFITDFRLSACMSLLKYIVHCSEEVEPCKSVIQNDGKVSINAFNFAVEQLNKLLHKLRYGDIDHKTEEVKPYDWRKFLHNFFRVVYVGLKFKRDKRMPIEKMLDMSKLLINELKLFFPAFDADGLHNIWILKPVNSCKGQGIHLCRTVNYVMNIIRPSARKYIVQKYVEKPLLIYDTKFDIRQWFLISNANPLTIWMYKECYIRFSSQLYSLTRLNESIHLTNNSIQCRYRNCVGRSSDLPSCNMWDSHQFRNYLTKIGKPTVFDDIIYPGMKEAITTAIVTNQTSLDTRKNCFEIYGSDFMITEDFQPWLIEINSNPALFASTAVTERMCPQVLEDLIKVVIDNVNNPKAPTGGFELIYKTASIQLQGHHLPSEYYCNTEDTKKGAV